MARNGSGTYSLPAGNPVVTGTTISSTWANNTLSDIATALTASVANDGQTPILANQNWGGFDITNIDLLDATTVQGDTGAFTDITMAGDFTASGSGKRFKADFTTSTVANRFAFQTTAANATTFVMILPNGGGTDAVVGLANNSTPTNSANVSLRITATEARLESGIFGAGSYLPLRFYTGGSQRGDCDASGNWTFATAATFSAAVALGGSATATTPALTDSDTSVATTDFVKKQLATAVAGFNYRRSTSQTSGTTVLFATSIFTELPSAGANYNTGTGTFTAPVDGLYHFEALVSMFNNTGAAQQQIVNLIGNGTTFATDSTACAASNTTTSSVCGDMVLSAGQTVIVNVSSPGISGVYSITNGFFSGHLVSRT